MEEENERRTREYTSLWPPCALAAPIRPHVDVSGNLIFCGKHLSKNKKIRAKVDSSHIVPMEAPGYGPLV